MYSLRNRPDKLAKGSLFCLFLKLVQINFIFTDNVRILYIYLQFILQSCMRVLWQNPVVLQHNHYDVEDVWYIIFRLYLDNIIILTSSTVAGPVDRSLKVCFPLPILLLPFLFCFCSTKASKYKIILLTFLKVNCFL